MTYPIIPELYGIVARKLLDEIGEKSFYSGSFSFDYCSKECRFVASIVVYRSKVCLPEGDADRIDDLAPRGRPGRDCGPGSRLVGIPYIRPSGGTPQRFLLFRA